MSVQSLFPTLIYFAPLLQRGGQKLLKEIQTECYQVKEYDEEGREWSKKNYVGGYTSYHSLSDMHYMSSTFRTLKEHIDKHVQKYAEELDFQCQDEELTMTDCWINMMPAQTTHSSHIHPLSVISGTYYVQCPLHAASIRFEDPRLERFMARPPRKESVRKRNRQTIELKPKEGHLVLFESWLRHEVPASLNTEDRISVSFNYR